MKYLIVSGGILLIIVIYILITYNIFVKGNNRVKEAFATMDVYLKKRWDLIPNIVEIVKCYAKHERDTLKEVTELRNKIKSYDDLTNEEKINTNELITKEISKLIAIAEAYPDLKANKNFLDLQKNLAAIEDEIAQSRKYYNAVVRIFNNKVEMIPSNIVAKITGFKIKKMYEATSEEKQNIKVKL